MKTKENKWKHIHSLELDKILELLSKEASCEESRIEIQNIEPITDFEEVENALNKTDEAYLLVSRYGSPEFYGGTGVRPYVKRAVAGGVLSMEELLTVAKFYSTVREFKHYQNSIDENDVEIKYLDELFWSLIPNDSLEKSITRAIISKDEMSDNASSTLREIRRKIMQNSSKIKQVLDEMVRSPKIQSLLQDQIITIRDGRYVLPVKSENRNEIPGMVHDTSSSGSTLFIEPMKVVEMNNEISILISKEKDEIQRILKSFTDEVKKNADSIIQSLNAVVKIDVIFSKARLAFNMEATRPSINNAGIIDLKKARHPLIDKKYVVPIDISIGEKYTSLIITGPNTGGKTVALKTLGLCTVMTMCGLMIPAREGSKVAIFENVLANIGDEQSIEQSLSTFSAHMTHIVDILKIADDSSLVLLDELGSGTDPIEGAALAMAILEYLKEQKSTILATTHYAELKTYALETEGVENASCEFDIETLTPTYKLLIGVPGKSNAFAISQKLGIKPSIIENAENFMSGDEQSFSRVVSRLEESERELEATKQEIEEAYRRADEAEKAASEMMENVEEERKQILIDAKNKAENILSDVRMNANFLINDLDEIRKNKNKIKNADEANKYKSKVEKGISGFVNNHNRYSISGSNDNDYELPRELQKGDYVSIEAFGKQGVVLNASKNSDTVLVQVGSTKTKVPKNTLKLIKPPKNKDKENAVKYKKQRTPSKSKQGGFAEIDIRGKNVDESILEVDKFLSDCVLTRVDTASIIHGKGTGILRAGIHEHLRKNPLVKDFRLGKYGEGEDGVTIVEL